MRRFALVVAVVAGNDGNARPGHQPSGPLLVSHAPVDGTGRSDEREPGLGHGIGEVAVLAEEAVPGVDRVRSAAPRGRDQRVDVQVARDLDGLVRHPGVERAAIDAGVDGHRGETHRAAGARDADRDLAAVRDQDLFHGTQLGFRFSRKARIPSCASSVTRMSAMRSTV